MDWGKEAIKKILSINEDFDITPEQMARHLKVTFFSENEVFINQEVGFFLEQLKSSFKQLGVEIIPFEKSLIALPVRKKLKRELSVLIQNLIILLRKFSERLVSRGYHADFLKIKRGKKVKPGIAIIAVSEKETSNVVLAVDFKSSLRFNPVITILVDDGRLTPEASYQEHIDFALRKFTWHMSDLIILVSKQYWRLYSFNGSYSSYSLKENFEKNILWSLVSKVSAPVLPPRLRDFKIISTRFDPSDAEHKFYVEDFIISGPLLHKTGLYPAQKKIFDLPFRNNLYRWLGSLYLDKRNGMSYGFLARQLPVSVEMPISFQTAREKFKIVNYHGQEVFVVDNIIYLLVKISDHSLFVRVPDVWVLSSRSGANKTQLDPKTDIVKFGLINGRLVIAFPKQLKKFNDYRPSFDTKVILAHALGNALFASISKYFNKNLKFSNTLQAHGMALIHWHGYLESELIPQNWYCYGQDNPPVSCSASQAAFYAFKGKESAIQDSILHDNVYEGDVHIEPDHGTNMSFSSLVEAARFLLENSDKAVLGNFVK